MKWLWVLILTSVGWHLQAQSRADWWYFGVEAGMHFTSTGPVAVIDSQMDTCWEGSTVVSDQQGNLLFYSDGNEVLDKNHNVMPNGSGLAGHMNATQTCIAVPRPGSATEYYLFTADHGNQITGDGLRYTKIDMSLNGGLGDVVTTEKNILIHPDVNEQVTAVEKPNGFWVMAHVPTSDTFIRFEVTSAGVSTTIQHQLIGTALAANSGGWIKFSPSGEKMAFAVTAYHQIDLYDFDVNTGLLSNLRTFGNGNNFVNYSIAFSPSEELLYTCGLSSGSDKIVQYDITQATAPAILATEQIIADFNTIPPSPGALQLGPDGKIYCARNLLNHVSCISNPDVYGAGCNFIDTALQLSGKISRVGLPQFIEGIFRNSINVSSFCVGDSTKFSFAGTAQSIEWNFGDPASGAANTSTLISPAHLYSDSGLFTVTAIVNNGGTFDTITKSVQIFPEPVLRLPADTTICGNDTLKLNIAQPFASYLWQDGSTADTFEVAQDSLLQVTVFGVCDTLSQSIQVNFGSGLALDLGPDLSFCEGTVVEIGSDLPDTVDVSWNTNAQTDSITVSNSGMYILTAINSCGTFADTINIEVLPLPDIGDDLLPNDTVICTGGQFILTRPSNDSITYIWSDSTSVKNYQIDTTETVWLAAFNACGFTVDTVSVVYNPVITTELGEDTVICDEDTIMLFGTDSLATYVWNTGDTTDTILTIPGESKNYVVTITLGACQTIESKRVDLDDLACPSIDCDLEYGNFLTPNGDGLNDRFRIWSDCDVYTFNMAIYNRWGQLIHYSRNVSFGWDGYVNGLPAAEGQYYFIVEYKDWVVVDSDRQINQGSFTLIR